MKAYDVGFIVCAVAGLTVLDLDKVAVEALISGITIGLYAGWRIWHGIK